VVDDDVDIRDVLVLICQADVLIGSRLHSLILGTVCGIPIIGIISDKKLYNFMKMLNLESLLVYPDEPMLHLKLFTLFEKIIKNKESIIKDIQLKRELLKLLCERNCLHILRQILLYEGNN
jgi:polysaccharide pyruvyl transferase WcaK-like protein